MMVIIVMAYGTDGGHKMTNQELLEEISVLKQQNRKLEKSEAARRRVR